MSIDSAYGKALSDTTAGIPIIQNPSRLPKIISRRFNVSTALKSLICPQDLFNNSPLGASFTGPLERSNSNRKCVCVTERRLKVCAYGYFQSNTSHVRPNLI